MKVISYHKGSVGRALMDLFPDVAFSKSKFIFECMIFLILFKFNYYLPIQIVASEEDRRNFFENYAATHKFNPLVPSNWYSQPKERFLSTKVFLSLIKKHKNI